MCDYVLMTIPPEFIQNGSLFFEIRAGGFRAIFELLEGEKAVLVLISLILPEFKPRLQALTCDKSCCVGSMLTRNTLLKAPEPQHALSLSLASGPKAFRLLSLRNGSIPAGKASLACGGRIRMGISVVLLNF